MNLLKNVHKIYALKQYLHKGHAKTIKEALQSLYFTLKHRKIFQKYFQMLAVKIRIQFLVNRQNQ